ncbi:DoxX family protein [Bacillus sp. DJP31]|uniref:DoxX family protein n=1 Tax=Bacillus sp. DJP31 TaxID=3409789 RepID=UPI003BB576D2
MIFDSLFKLLKIAHIVEATLELGFSEHHLVVIGILGLLSVILYNIPRLSVLGVLLLTEYIGVAIATHIRLGNPFFLIHFFQSI